MTKKVASPVKGARSPKESQVSTSRDEEQFASSLDQFLTPALGKALTEDVKQRLLAHYGPNVRLSARKIQFLVPTFDPELDGEIRGSEGVAENQFSRAYNRFGRAYNRFGRAYNRFAR